MTGRVPPHALEAEGAIVSCALLEPKAVAWAAGSLEPEHFYSEANGRIWGAIQSLVTVGAPCDVVTVAEWLRRRERLQSIGGPAYLAQLVDATPHVSERHFTAYLADVLTAWRKRARIAIYQRGAAELYGDVGDPEDHANSVDAELLKVRLAASGDVRPQLLAEVVDEHMRAIAAQADGGEPRFTVRFGLRDFDRQTGGMPDGDLVILAARPGMGKTSLALAGSANAAAAGIGAAFFSLEMPNRQVAARILSQRAGVDASRMRDLTLQPEDWSKLANVAASLATTEHGAFPLWLFDRVGTTVASIRGMSLRVAADCARMKRRLGLVVVDHLGWIKPDNPKATRNDQLGAITAGLKSLAKELGCVVVALCQLSRECERRPDKRPLLSDLRDSGNIEQDADQVIALYREGYYDESADPTQCEAIWRKFRSGKPSTVMLGWDEKTTTFYDLAVGGDSHWSR